MRRKIPAGWIRLIFHTRVKNTTMILNAEMARSEVSNHFTGECILSNISCSNDNKITRNVDGCDS
jgi:hypothetical protein